MLHTTISPQVNVDVNCDCDLLALATENQRCRSESVCTSYVHIEHQRTKTRLYQKVFNNEYFIAVWTKYPAKKHEKKKKNSEYFKCTHAQSLKSLWHHCWEQFGRLAGLSMETQKRTVRSLPFNPGKLHFLIHLIHLT